MIKKFKFILISTFLILFASNAYSAQKDCSAFTHKLDIKICEAQNLESVNKNASTKDSENKGGGFFSKIVKKLNLKDNQKFRKVGD